MTSTPQQNRPLPVINGWRPLAAADQAAAARAEAEQVLANARSQAEQIRSEATQRAEQKLADAATQAQIVLRDAAAEGDRIRAEATQAEAKKQTRGNNIDMWSLRGALAATIGLTASGEFALAQLAGWTPGLAWLLPVAIDVYVVQAFRRHRDVPAALLLMVVANAIYHLAERGLFGIVTEGGEPVLNSHGEPRPEWWLIVAVAAIAPVVMWRIHRLSAPPRKRDSKQPESTPQRRESATRSRTARNAPARESKPPARRESARETSTHQPATRTTSRESKPPRAVPAPPKPRDSSGKPSPIQDEIDRLVALMRERGGADAVTLTDAERIVASDSQATAARRLKAARETYRNSN